MTVEASSTFWIGLDDTDEREHGCTTFDFNDLATHLEKSGFTISDPRLVRLWPFAPQRTRGNAALSAAVLTTNRDGLVATLDAWFTNRFRDNQMGTELHSAQPVLLMTNEQLPEKIYWDTVKHHVVLENRRNELDAIDHQFWSTPAGQSGLIGASAAIAWRGEHDCTWECTAWRNQLGARDVPEHIVNQMCEKYPETILNRDPNASRSLIAPRTPCPVLYGIRGESRDSVLKGHKFLQENGVESSFAHRAHRTNQATDDHIDEMGSGAVTEIDVMQGGHVTINTGQKLLSFSQGGPLNSLAQSLEIGDEIEWYGLVDEKDAVHLERLRLAHGKRNSKRPLCHCGKRYKSQGKGQGLKCPECGSTTDDIWEYDIEIGDWVEPTASSRRHLSKPLSRMGNPEGR